jgi:hypothetical protein
MPKCNEVRKSLGGNQMRICSVLAAFALTLAWMSASAQPTCPAGTTTSVSGTVYAPNGTDPLPNALVYVPSAPVASFSPGAQCLPAGQLVSGSPSVQTVSNVVDGTFTLTNVPTGANIPLVIQVGKWRRKVSIPSVMPCQNTALTPTQTRLPTRQAEFDVADNIPQIAIVTGAVDAPECVLRKIGISDTQFSNPPAAGGAGRIHLYKGAVSAGAVYSSSTPSETQLWGTQATLNQYDAVMFSSQGKPANQSAAAQSNLVNYANAGGRIFASRFAYAWLYNAPQFSSTATWAVGGVVTTSTPTAVVNQSFAGGAQLAQWLQRVGASTTLGQIAISNPQTDVKGVVAPTQSWLSVGQSPVQFTFNTPVGSPPANQCGRVLFNDYNERYSSSNTFFPQACTSGAMTGEEKLLEYQLFELTGGQ